METVAILNLACQKHKFKKVLKETLIKCTAGGENPLKPTTTKVSKKLGKM
jgi:hypothetical protein